MSKEQLTFPQTDEQIAGAVADKLDDSMYMESVSGNLRWNLTHGMIERRVNGEWQVIRSRLGAER